MALKNSRTTIKSSASLRVLNSNTLGSLVTEHARFRFAFFHEIPFRLHCICLPGYEEVPV